MPDAASISVPRVQAHGLKMRRTASAGRSNLRRRDALSRRCQRVVGWPRMTATSTTLQNFIDGEFVDPADGQTEPILNPATGEVIAHAPLSTRRGRQPRRRRRPPAFDGWSTTTPGERALALLKLADAIEEHADEISELESDNAGKPINAFRDDEIPFMVDNLRFFAGAARCLEGRAAGEYMAGYTSIIRREPIGVIGQIAPWNYPLMMAVWKIGPALAAGNTVVLKPAETTPAVDAASSPSYAAEILPAGRAQRDHRPRRPDRPGAGHAPGRRHGLADRLGRAPASGSPSAAADTLKRVHLELGGKAPVVVFDDVELETALETIAGTGYYNAGQDCTAATRVLAGAQGLRRRRRRARRAGQGAGHGRHPLGGHDARSAQLGPPARAGRGLPRAQARPRRDRHRRQRARQPRLLPRADGRRRPRSRTTR